LGLALLGLEHRRAEPGLPALGLRGGLLVGLGLAQRRVEPVGLDLEVRAQRFCRLERLLQGLLRHVPAGLAADLVAEGHARAAVVQEDERGGLTLLLLEDDRWAERGQEAAEDRQES